MISPFQKAASNLVIKPKKPAKKLPKPASNLFSMKVEISRSAAIAPAFVSKPTNVIKADK